MENALDYYVDANKAVHNLDIPNKETIEAITKSAMRMVAWGLSQNTADGFKLVIDIDDKLKAIGDYIRAKRGQDLADLATQNKIVVTRIYSMQEMGKWLEKHLAHLRFDGKDIQGRPISTPNNDEQFWLEELKITKDQSSDWQMLGRIAGQTFDIWLNDFVNKANEGGIELWVGKVIEFVRPKQQGQEKKTEPNLLPHMKAVYLDADNLLVHLPEMIRGICEGNTPREQFIKVRDLLKELPAKIDLVLREAGEMY